MMDYNSAATRLHSLLDAFHAVPVPAHDCLLRLIADDMECTSNPLGHASTFIRYKMETDTVNREFWQRLLGNVKKSETL